jgi:hypothetical protein
MEQEPQFLIVACDDRFGHYRELLIRAADLETALSKIKTDDRWKPSYRIVGWLTEGEF